MFGGSSDGDDQAAPGHSGKVSKAGQRKQQRTASHPYKTAAAAAVYSVSVCDGDAGTAAVHDNDDVAVGGVVLGWDDEWTAKLIQAKQATGGGSAVYTSAAHCTDFDAAANALLDESVCLSPFTLHSLPKLPTVSLHADMFEEPSYSEPLSPLSTSSVDDSVFTSTSSTVLSSRSLSTTSSSAAADDRPRCSYPSTAAALHHHDHVLGRSLYHHPSVDTSPTEALNRVYAMLCLAVLCTGLDLPSVLKKWEDLKAAFDEFDVVKVSGYGPKDVERLKRNPKVMKDKVKINAIIHNATAIQRLETAKPGSFITLLWSQHTKPVDQADHFPEAERILPSASLVEQQPGSTLPLSTDCEVDFAAARTAVVVADGVSPSRAILRLKLLLSGVKLKRMGDAACLQFAQSVGLVNHHSRACYCFQHCEDEYGQVMALRQQQRQVAAV